MTLRPVLFWIVPAWLAAGAAWGQSTATEDSYRPALFFREDFRETPAATPITQQHIANPHLILSLYGPGKEGMKKSHHTSPPDDPYYIWNGTCPTSCAAGLRDKDSYADLTGFATFRWRTKQSGFHALHFLVKLADGTWLISEQSDGPSSDWREREFIVQDLRWRKFDIEKVVEGDWAERPNLSRVDEIGWTDLMAGGGTPASSRVDWIEVHGRAVPRTPIAK